MLSRLFFIPTLLLSVFFLPLSSYLSFPPSWPAWAYCPARRSHFFLPSFLLFPLVIALVIALSSHSIFSYSRLHPPLPLSSALVVSQGVCPKWLGPTWQHLLYISPKVVACRHGGRLLLCVAFALLPSLRAVTMFRLRFWCRLCWWMLWITWHAIVSWHSPYYFRFSFPHHKLATLLFGA